MQEDKVFKLLKVIPAGMYNGAIWTVSSLTMPANTNNFDKSAHIIEYGLMGFLLAFAFQTQGKYHAWTKNVIIFGCTLAGIDEFHQYFVPTRSMSIFDFIADFVGILIGFFIWIFVVKLLRYFKLKLFSKKVCS